MSEAVSGHSTPYASLELSRFLYGIERMNTVYKESCMIICDLL